MSRLERELDRLTARLDDLLGWPSGPVLMREYRAGDEVTRLYLQGGHVVRVEAFDECTGEPCRPDWWESV